LEILDFVFKFFLNVEVSLDGPVGEFTALFLNLAVDVLLVLLVGLDKRNGLALSFALSINQHLAAVLVDRLLLSALLLHLSLELNRRLFDGAGVHLLNILIFVEFLKHLLVFIKFGETVFKNVI